MKQLGNLQYFTDNGISRINTVNLPTIFLNPRDVDLKSRLSKVGGGQQLSNVQSMQEVPVLRTMNLDSEMIRNYKSRQEILGSSPNEHLKTEKHSILLRRTSDIDDSTPTGNNGI